MVGWGFAFKKGFILWLWCLLWIFVGVLALVIPIFIGGRLLFPVLQNPPPNFEAFIESILPIVISIIVGIIVGPLIVAIGIFASIVKVVTDAVEEQAAKRSPAETISKPAGPTPPSVAQYCPNCRRQIVDPSVVFCPDCGAKITE